MDSSTTTDGINNQRQTEEKNFGEFILVYFDKNEKNFLFDSWMREVLPSTISFTKSFDDIQLCEEWIKERRLKDEKVILFLEELPADIEQVIERLHGEPHLHSICFIDEKIEQWTEKYPKVHVAVRDSTITLEEKDELLHLSDVTLEELGKITEELHEYNEKLIESLSTIPLYNGKIKDGLTSSELTIDFYYRQVLIDVMTKIPYTDLDRQEFLQFLKRINSNDPPRLKVIQKYEENNPSLTALQWYTKELCFYGILNKALRTSDIETVTQFQPFIFDLFKDLNKLYSLSVRSSSNISVYRSQRMAKEEVEELQTMVNTNVSIYSFFSTTMDPTVSKWYFPGGSNDDFQAVMLEIEIPSQLTDKTYRPNITRFADISSVSNHADEDEILFMLGSVFRVTDVLEKKEADNTSYTLVKLQLIDDKNTELTDGIRRDMEKELFTLEFKEYNQYSLATILNQMGCYSVATIFYQRQLNEIESIEGSAKIDALCGLCYAGIGHIAMRRGDTVVYEHYNLMALARSTRFPYDNMEDFMDRFENLSHGQQLKNDVKLIELLKSLEIIQQSYNGNEHDHLKIGGIYFDLMEIYYLKKKWKDAITSFKRASNIMKKYLPNHHPDRLLLNLYHIDISYDMLKETGDIEAFDQFMSINKRPSESEKYRVIFDNVLVKEQNYTIKELLGDELKYLIKNEDTRSEAVQYIRIPIDDVLKGATAIGILFSSSGMTFFDPRHYNRHLAKFYREMFTDEGIKKFPFEIILIPYIANQKEFDDIFQIMPWTAVEYGNDSKRIWKRNLEDYFGTFDTVHAQPTLVILKTSNGEVLSKNGIDAINSRKLDAIQLWCDGKRVERLTTLEEEKQYRWTYIGCNACEQVPLTGLRYKCQSCEDYDLCQRCHQTDEHQHHQFDLIKKPVQYY